ncbi:MAG: GtrA family protein [Candidatus Sungbacteria bacterium]|nr:GtrA family protein [Candidatus Sungbacteria bacterium]
MQKQSDIFIAAIIGFGFGLFAIPVLFNLGSWGPGFWFLLPVLFSLFAAGAFFLARFFSKFWPPLLQFAKFAAVGALNFAIDFGVLNGLIFLTGIAAGSQFIVFKTISVVLAITNSYLWNKFWTFQDREIKGAGREFLEFLIVTLIGIGINVGAAHFMVNILGPQGGIDPKAWANIGAGVSVVVTLFWNFFGYKFFVFKKAEVSEVQTPNWH